MSETRLIQKQLAGKEDLLLGIGKATQKRASGDREITKLNVSELQGALVVDTIEELQNLDHTTLTEKTVVVKDLDRGGTFIYRSENSAVNNGGTIFNGWTRQYDGAVNVKWFGAKGDGVTDDTVAFQNCYKAIVLNRENNQSTVFDYTSSVFAIPKGKYLITDSITQSTGVSDGASGIIFCGEKSILIGSGNFNFFEFRTGCDIVNISFQGGGRVFYIQSGNSDSASFNITGVTMQNQTIESFGSDSNSASSIVNIDKCKIYCINTVGSATKKISTMAVDTFNLTNSWLYYGGTGEAFNVGGKVNVDKNLFVPNYLLGSLGIQECWFKATGSIVIGNGNRFGSEGGGTVILKYYGVYEPADTETKVTVINNAIALSSKYAVEFYGLPTSIDIYGNYGYEDAYGIVYFDSTISLDNIRNSLYRGNFRIDDIGDIGYNIYSGNATVSNYMAQKAIKKENSYPLMSDLILSRNTDLSASNILVTSSGTSFSSALRNGRTCRLWDSADTGVKSVTLNSEARGLIITALAGAGWITVVSHITIFNENSIAVTVVSGNNKETQVLTPGVNLINSHIYYDGVNLPQFEVYLNVTDVTIGFGPVRIFKNIYTINSEDIEFIGNAPSTLNSPIFFNGEVIKNNSVSAGGFVGQICTTSGTPGTWKSFGAISA